MLPKQRLDPREGDRLIRTKDRQRESSEEPDERDHPSLCRMVHSQKFR